MKINLDRYWEGSSSLEEEKYIRDFYKYGDVPAHLETFRSLFAESEVEMEASLGREFDQAIMAKIEADQGPKSRFGFLRIAAVAVVLIIASVTFFKADTEKVTIAEDTSQNPEEALEETKKAFLLIAEALNKGEQSASQLRNLDEANEKIKTK